MDRDIQRDVLINALHDVAKQYKPRTGDYLIQRFVDRILHELDKAPKREYRPHHLEVLLGAVSEALEYSWDDCDGDVIETMDRLRNVFTAYNVIESGAK